MSHSFIHYIGLFLLLINITRTAVTTLSEYCNQTQQDGLEIILFTNQHGVNPDTKNQDPISLGVFLKIWWTILFIVFENANKVLLMLY